jgi:hypothetical protein
VAPIQTLQVAADPAQAGWHFQAQVVARYAGLRDACVELRLDDGSPLKLFETGAPLAVGDRVGLVQPERELVALTGA